MTTIVQIKSVEIRKQLAAWAPLMVLPIAAGTLTAVLPACVRMLAIAISIYAGFKWATFALSPAVRRASIAKSVGYLCLWTGMDAEAFFGPRKRAESLRWSELAWAASQMAFG